MPGLTTAQPAGSCTQTYAHFQSIGKRLDGKALPSKHVSPSSSSFLILCTYVLIWVIGQGKGCYIRASRKIHRYWGVFPIRHSTGDNRHRRR